MHYILQSFAVLLFLFLFNEGHGNTRTDLPFPEYDIGHSISYDDWLNIARKGLPKTASKKKIIVVGAGMAGLTAAYALEQAGHEVTILESSDHVGGRVRTYRDPGGWQVELGAMRIPSSHLLVGSFIKEIFNLETLEFPHFDENTYIYVNGIRVKTKEYIKNPDCVGYETAENEKGMTAEELFDGAIKSYSQEIREHGWKVFMEKYDGLSLRNGLMSKNFSDAALCMIGILSNMEGFFDYALTEGLEIFYDLTEDSQFYSIRGGNDLLPKAFTAVLNSTEIIYNARVVKVTRPSQGGVIAEYLNENRLKNLSGSYVIMTPDPVAMSFIEFNPPLSFRKRSALRQMQTGCSTKIVAVFSERFWEKEGIFGGKTITDLPSHVLYYLTGGSNFTGGLVVSYTWATRSCTLASRSEQELLEMALNNLVTIHGEHIRELFTGGTVKHWSLDPYIFGAYTYYSPYQRLKIHDDLEKPDDSIWFAGEYVNVPHAWIESAVKSALRTAVALDVHVWAGHF